MKEVEREKLDKLEIHIKIGRNNFETMYSYKNILEPYIGNLEWSYASLELSAVYKSIEHSKTIPYEFNEIVVYIPSSLYSFISSNYINFEKKQLSVKEIYLDHPLFSQYDYEGNKPKEANLTDVLDKIPVIAAVKWNNSGWQMTIKNIAILEGAFRNDKFTIRPAFTGRFDGAHLHFSSITGTLKNVQVMNDTLIANISLKAQEQSGLLIKKLQSQVKFSPEIMEFSELDLQTNRSKLGPYYAMRYRTFNEDFSSFLHNVVLEADFKESVVNSDDLALFAPELSAWKKIFYLDGHAKGTIDNFSAKQMHIRAGRTYFEGDFALRGLPDINSSYIDFRSKLLQTSYSDLAALVPSLSKIKMPAFYKLGNIKFTGNYTGFLNDFVTYGNFSTALGNVGVDLNMKLPAGKAAIYSGIVSTGGFNLGAFLNNSQLGNIVVNGKIKGQGFNLADLHATFTGEVKSIYALGYNYQQIKIDGNFEKRLFTGHFSINDPNLKISKLDGSIRLPGKEMGFDADATVEYANLKNLGLTDNPFSFSGLFNLRFTGNNIDNFLGTAMVSHASLQHDSTKLSFDSLVLRSFYRENKKYLSLSSNEVEAEINGHFNIASLPDAFSVFLSRYYPSYIKIPGRNIADQDFSFSIKTKNADQYTSLLDKRLGGFDNSTITGNLALSRNELNIQADVPEFSYQGKIFRNILLQGKGNRDTLHTDVTIEDIQINDSLHLPDTKIKLTAHNDVSVIQLKTSAGRTLSDAELNASIQTYTDGVRIHFFPSSFVINDKRWELKKDGELILRKKFINANEINFAHQNQQIVISTELDDVTDNTHLVAKLTNVNVEDFLPFVLIKPSFKGLLTGTAVVRDPFGKPAIEFSGIADSLIMDGQYIGKVNLSANANTTTGLVKFTANADDKEYVFSADGNYNYLDKSSNNLNIAFLSDRFNLRILQPYLGSIFSQISGNAKSNLVIKNRDDYPQITGDVTVTDGSLKIAFTQCRYLFNNHTIRFGNNVIDLGMMPVKDTLNNEGLVSGKIYHHFFNAFSFDNLRFETSRMLLLNTTKKDNSQFYGNVTGNALMTLNGPITNMRMNIDGEPSIIDSSHIYLPTNALEKENKTVDYIEFIQFGSEMELTQSNNQQANLLVNMNLTANPSCKIDVILDEATGDVIKGRGNGKLNIRAGTTEPLSIRGRYDLTRGEYTFNFQTFLKKPFTLSNGSITWNGDPLLAILDIEAEYVAKAVKLSDLSTTGSSNQKEDLIILSHITGNLQNPTVHFEFRLPEKSDLNRDYLVVKKLAEFQNDENEMYKQVASLLLFNQFISNSQNFLSGGNTLSLATNTIGGVVSSWLTNLFNKELERATNGVISTYIDINPSVDLQKSASQLQASVKAGLKILLSNRLNVLIGGNLDYNNPYAQLNRKGLLTPDITVEWLLNKDGSLRVVGFNRTSIDLTNGQRNRSGVQLSYRKNFNRLSDIFKSKKKLAKEDVKAKSM